MKIYRTLLLSRMETLRKLPWKKLEQQEKKLEQQARKWKLP